MKQERGGNPESESTENSRRNFLIDQIRVALNGLVDSPLVVVVVAIGLDRMSQINDTWGYVAGDLVVESAAERLRSSFHQCTAVNTGTDHFAVVCTLPQDDDVEADTARKAIEAVTGKYRIQEHDIYVTASVGVAASADFDSDPDALLSAAETARVEARHSGGRRWERADQSLRVRVREQVRTEQALYGAIENDELSVRYQPVIDLFTRSTIGYEALARWQSPELGNVPPAYFIPRAEETGLIVPLGHWILDEIATKWRRVTSGFSDRQFTVSPATAIAVNVSGVQIRLDLEHLIEHLVDCADAIRGQLWVEITESVLLDHPDTMLEALTYLRDRGIHLVVDDFGTGYSSLNQLRVLPVDAIKIDRVFVGRIHESPRDQAIVRAMIQLAHALGILAVAEGVETEAQLEALDDMGCDQVQGFLFSPAVPFHQLDGSKFDPSLNLPTLHWHERIAHFRSKGAS